MSLQPEGRAKIQSESGDERIGNEHKALNEVSQRPVMYIAGPVSTLLIFDDVCSPSVQSVLNVIQRCPLTYSIVITTRSTAVKLFLEKEMPPLQTIELHPFSVADSLKLVSMKAKFKTDKEAVAIDSVVKKPVGEFTTLREHLFLMDRV